MIDVEAIDFISFTGEYPEEVAGVGFHPARAALRSSRTTLLNSPLLQNIGYAVIVLKQQPKEALMPDFVSGNLTAHIKYDIQNAFGVGQATQYVPELNDGEWNENYAKYGFWSGRGFIRAEGIKNDGAVISVYSDKENKVSTFSLKKGETSPEIYLPGFYCQAGMTLRLDDLKSPDTRARLNINGEIVEIAEREQFLENRCTVRRIDKKGLASNVEISCGTDNGFQRVVLQISPKIKLNIDGNEQDVGLGERVFITADNQKSVYLAYIGTEGNTENTEDLFLYFLSMPEQKDKLSEDDLASAKILVNQLVAQRITGSGAIDLAFTGIKVYVGLANYAKQYLLDGKDISKLRYKEDKSVIGAVFGGKTFGKNIKILGQAEPGDEQIKDSLAKNYFEQAITGYKQVIDNFANDKEKFESTETFGEEAFLRAIELASRANQKKTLVDLCGEFKSKFPNKEKESNAYCNAFKISNSENSASGVVINGRTKLISLEGVSEPSFEDFGAEILVRKPNENPDSYLLTKNEIIVLEEAPLSIFKFRMPNAFANTEIVTGISSDYPLFVDIYLGFVDGNWQWSSEKTNWMRLSEKAVARSDILEFRNKKLDAETLSMLNELKKNEANYDAGKKLLAEKYNATREPDIVKKDFIQLLDLNDDSARIRVNFRKTGTEDFFYDEMVLRRNVGGSAGGYLFTLTQVSLKKTAQVSVLPRIKNAGTDANFSFNIGIEKRAIQLSPDKIKERIKRLNETIKEWEDNSEKLGNVVRGFNAACLAVGTTLTIKNLFENFDGRAIARQEVMRNSGGWYDSCKARVSKGEFSTVDKCLLENSDKIERDVNTVENTIKNQEGITEDNAERKLPEIRNLAGNSITNPDKSGESIDTSANSNVGKAFSKEGYNEGKISLSQARDIERLSNILKTNPGPELKLSTERRLFKIFSDIDANSKYFSTFTLLQDELAGTGLNLGVNSYNGPNAVRGEYHSGVLSGNQIFGATETFSSDVSYPTEILHFEGRKYIAFLEGEGSRLFLNRDKIYEYVSASKEGVTVRPADEKDKIAVSRVYSEFTRADISTYQNKILNPEVKYFDVEPYKGLPAIVPFDRANGWYVATRQTLPGFGNIRAYDDSGKVNSFYLCNVGSNGRVEFDDTCEGFNPGIGQTYNRKFPGLDEQQTSQLVSRAMNAVEQASRSRAGKQVSILNDVFPVGTPEVGIPDIQCQDFMSPDECLLLFNTCDPVVCPSSRCNLGGTYTVPDVIQSGIIGSAALCLPNARENIVVPVCLSGVKAGIDSLVSVQKNYRDCLQTNLETGETVGICDEIHSIYLCDFFWSQTQPLAGIIVPKIFEAITGQTGRGGGEYLGVASAWANADKSVNYLTQYYGAASFEAFRTGVIKEVGHAICNNFISASYPSKMDFFDSLIEPESPPQYTAWFSEQPFSTATIPPTSRYKVFYHIFAGKNEGEAGRNAGAFFSVYLKSPPASSFFQYSPTITVASGFIPPGEFASETRDFTSPANYRELCIRVNAQEECGFNRVTTEFGLDYLQDLYINEQAGQTDINSESACVAGTPSLYSFANPNLQEGVQEFVDPSLYSSQIVRVCSTDNPGAGTDPFSGTKKSRWIQVGTCDDGKGNLKCYLDRESVKKVITSTEIENQTLESLTDNYAKLLQQEGEFIQNFDEEITKIEKFDAKGKINYITSDLISKVSLNGQKAKLIMIKAKAYGELALERLLGVAEKTGEGIGSDASIAPAGGRIGGKTDLIIDLTTTGSIDGAIKELERINSAYPNPSTVFYSSQYPDFSEFVDRLATNKILTIGQYNEIKKGTINYNLPYLIEFLKNIRDSTSVSKVNDYQPALKELERMELVHREKGYNLPISYGDPFSEFGNLVDNLYRQGLLTKKEYAEISGDGLFNLEENSVFVKDLLRKKIVGQQNPKYLSLSKDISELEGILNKYGDVKYACRTSSDSVICQYSDGAEALKTFIDKVKGEGFLTSEEYSLLITGNWRGRIYGVQYLLDLLEDKKDAL